MKRPRETDTAVPLVMPLPPLPDDVEEESLSHDGRYIRYKFKFIYGFIPRIYLELPPRYQRPMRGIHKGTYDDICMAVDSNTGEDVAIKKLRSVFDIWDPKRPLREIQILRHMNHKNVIVLRDVIPPPRRETFDDVYIVYELMQNDLEEKILTDGALPNERCQYFLYQLLCGLKYIHSANIIHGDLKPDHLLLDAKDDLKIGNFRFARNIGSKMSEHVSSRLYRAPELVMGTLEYTKAVDVWSAGCIFMRMVRGRIQFREGFEEDILYDKLELIASLNQDGMEYLNEIAMRYCNRNLPQPRSFRVRFPMVNDKALDLVERMLAFKPTQRITVEDALAHPYLAPLHGTGDESICRKPFKDKSGQQNFSVEEMKELVYRKALSFNPNQQQ